MDTTGLAHPKPRDAKIRCDSSRVTKDGRLIESPARYRRTKADMWLKQGGLCAKCGRGMPSVVDGHRHHPGGRGLGGGKRDDRKTVLWCTECHTEHHA